MQVFSPKKILVPTDFSDYSETAFRETLDVAKRNNSKVYLLHVIDDHVEQIIGDYGMGATMEPYYKQIQTETEKSAQASLNSMINKFAPESKEVEVITEIRRGNPPKEIVKETHINDYDLIVMYSHGKSGLGVALLGSVAEDVLHHAKCPVLLIRS
jgi:universal stress protein A